MFTLCEYWLTLRFVWTKDTRYCRREDMRSSPNNFRVVPAPYRPLENWFRQHQSLQREGHLQSLGRRSCFRTPTRSGTRRRISH